MDSVTLLVEFFSKPVVRVSQLLAKYELDDEESTEYWAGDVPVLVFTVEGHEGERSLAVAGRDYDLSWRVLDTACDVVSQVERFVVEELGRDQSFAGIASLDIALNPVPGWTKLVPESFTMVEKDQNLLGFSLLLNLGTRVGVFVAPNPGIALTFNEQCDTVLEQARKLEALGKLKIVTQTYEQTTIPKKLSEVDWFDWLK